MRLSRLVLCFSVCDCSLCSVPLRTLGVWGGQQEWMAGQDLGTRGHVGAAEPHSSSLTGSVWRMRWTFRPGSPVGWGGVCERQGEEPNLGWRCCAQTRKRGKRGCSGAGVGGCRERWRWHGIVSWAPASVPGTHLSINPPRMVGIYISISIYWKGNKDLSYLSQAAQLVSSRARIQG